MMTTLVTVSKELLKNARCNMLSLVASTAAKFCQITHLVGQVKPSWLASGAVFDA